MKTKRQIFVSCCNLREFRWKQDTTLGRYKFERNINKFVSIMKRRMRSRAYIFISSSITFKEKSEHILNHAFAVQLEVFDLRRKFKIFDLMINELQPSENRKNIPFGSFDLESRFFSIQCKLKNKWYLFDNVIISKQCL
ncbi:hypothetical protein ACOSP7_019751 [Xanthoceras sorbifolium]